jgi:hypothetical protein
METISNIYPPTKFTGNRLFPNSPLTDVLACECFGEEAVDHVIHGAVCVSRDRKFLDPISTFSEYVRACFVLAKNAEGHSWGQPIWFMVRQVMELGLKELIFLKSAKTVEKTKKSPERKFGHCLIELLSYLRKVESVACSGELEKFILRMGKYDPGGDQARYFYKKVKKNEKAPPGLADVCCIDPQKLVYFVGLMRKEVIPDTDWHE